MSVKRITLAEYVAQKMAEKSFSERDVDRRSGGAISSAYVNQIKNNQKANLSTSMILGLAKGLDVPEIEVFMVAAGLPFEPIEEQTDQERRLLNFFRNIPAEFRKAILVMIESVSSLYAGHPIEQAETGEQVQEPEPPDPTRQIMEDFGEPPAKPPEPGTKVRIIGTSSSKPGNN